MKKDYYFNGDAGDWDNGLSLANIIETTKFNNIKFIGLTPFERNNWEYQLGRLMKGCIYYNTKKQDRKYNKKWKATQHTIKPEKNIDKNLISRSGSISFDVLQFLLFAGFKKIYLVGQDCDYKDGSWDNNTPREVTQKNKLLVCWELMIDFIKINYPDVEIINVNPVALKPYFKSITLEELYNLKG
jgi:hypothetical protein